MLSGIRIFVSDPVWRDILTRLNASVVDNALFADVNFDNLQPDAPVSPLQLKSIIIGALDNRGALDMLPDGGDGLSPIQAQIVKYLVKNGEMTAEELKIALGYAPDANTHTVSTVIYALRKKYGREFIQNKDGKFKIGGI